LDDLTKKITDGYLNSLALLGEGGVAAAADIVHKVNSNGVETIRVVFADPHGILRGKTITAHALTAVFTSGVRVPSTLLLKDVSHRTVFPVWSEDGAAPMRGASDVLLVPQADTFRVLPHSPHSAIIHANIVHMDGTPVSFSSRAVLIESTARLAEQGYSALMGLEVEFNVFAVADAALDHSDTTMPPRPPQTRAINQGFQYLTETRYSDCEEMLDRLRRAAEAMGMPVRSVEIEMGPSQFEFTFDPADPLTIADMAVNFRTLVKEVCHREGLLASFMSKPHLPNVAANGWHIHQSIVNNATGQNAFISRKDGKPSETASAWMAGLLAHAAASCLLTTPTVNGYKRYAPHQLAPNRIGWGVDNRGAMVRALLTPGDAASRVENRVAESAVNPYFALASQIVSGLHGVNNELSLAEPLLDPYEADVELLPSSLGIAIDNFASSALYREYLGAEFVEYLTHLKRAEWNRYLMTVSDWEQAEYFTAF